MAKLLFQSLSVAAVTRKKNNYPASRPMTNACCRFKLLLAGLAMALNTAAAQTEQINQELHKLISNKLLLLQSMVMQSATARRIEASSHSNEAKTLLEQSRTAYHQAQALFQQGDLKTSEENINEGLRLFGDAARNVADLKRKGAKEQQRYEDLSKRVDSFRQAFARIVTEKGPATLELLDQTGVHAKLQEASKRYSEQRFHEANLALEQVLAKLELALIKARDQETLVRVLTFSSAADEYAYEVERNHSHEMLLHLLLAKAQLNTARQMLIDRFTALNASARSEAAELAQRSEHDAALQKLETGTQQLVRALRVAGMAF